MLCTSTWAIACGVAINTESGFAAAAAAVAAEHWTDAAGEGARAQQPVLQESREFGQAVRDEEKGEWLLSADCDAPHSLLVEY